MIVMVVCGYGLNAMQHDGQPDGAVLENSEIVHSYAWPEDHLGPLVPMEIVVRLDEKNCNLTFLDRMQLVQRSSESGKAERCWQFAVGRDIRGRSGSANGKGSALALWLRNTSLRA